ncbi:N-acetylated-alpha-linked acidic dipeptidase 2 [Plakobranchus ocellatus]|uniref:N-acetylated-alpha-linked acidic dipeptidase 2 n=1 Tax=Plakobranchus ocellatus TaxID=259542 RepID=A0AAV4BEQ0_9GAST|nr:N-acetylated-alpha-linked acidic dipeptidase 2 [Plakobranchus ocellatus]
MLRIPWTAKKTNERVLNEANKRRSRQYVATLRERAVAYINMDTAVVGNDTLRLGAVPLMHKVAYEAAKKVENPNPAERAAGRASVYDTWLHIEPWMDENGQSKDVPRIHGLGSGSDFAPFLQKIGIPALELCPYIIRQINDQMMLLERAFLDPAGLPLRPLKKHLLFAENAHDVYAGSSFPGLIDLLFQIDLDKDPQGRWKRVRHHFSVILHTIQSAGATLREVNKFMMETL